MKAGDVATAQGRGGGPMPDAFTPSFGDTASSLRISVEIHDFDVEDWSPSLMAEIEGQDRIAHEVLTAK